MSSTERRALLVLTGVLLALGALCAAGSTLYQESATCPADR